MNKYIDSVNPVVKETILAQMLVQNIFLDAMNNFFFLQVLTFQKEQFKTKDFFSACASSEQLVSRPYDCCDTLIIKSVSIQ